jgi:hypothetical protein
MLIYRQFPEPDVVALSETCAAIYNPALSADVPRWLCRIVECKPDYFEPSVTPAHAGRICPASA